MKIKEIKRKETKDRHIRKLLVSFSLFKKKKKIRFKI